LPTIYNLDGTQVTIPKIAKEIILQGMDNGTQRIYNSCTTSIKSILSGTIDMLVSYPNEGNNARITYVGINSDGDYLFSFTHNGGINGLIGWR